MKLTIWRLCVYTVVPSILADRTNGRAYATMTSRDLETSNS